MHNDASIIKKKDVKTDKSGEYSTTYNISVLSVVCLSGGFLGLTNKLFISYAIHYNESSNTLVLLAIIIHHMLIINR